jgi:Na+/melibiose symporter-like transporter
VNDYTGTFYAGLYCNNRDVRMWLQSIFAIGTVICITFIPIISDSKGKKFAFFLALLAMLIGDVGLFLGTFNKIYFLIAIC